MINHLDCSIRKSADQSVLTTPRSLSQLTTSFIGSWCQGIHPALFLTLPIFKWVSVLFKNCSFPTRKISFTRISLVALLVVSYLHFSILFSSCSVLFQEQVSAKAFLLLISILEKRFSRSLFKSSTRVLRYPNNWTFTASRLSSGKWAQVDSNHRPHAYQACALTTWAMRPFGGDEEDRTPDPLLAKQVLSQLSYTPDWFVKVLPASSKLNNASPFKTTGLLWPGVENLFWVAFRHVLFAP